MIFQSVNGRKVEAKQTFLWEFQGQVGQRQPGKTHWLWSPAGAVAVAPQVGLAMVVVESAVTSMYICYAEDPLLTDRWDTEFFNQMSEILHQRSQHRSARPRDVLTHTDNQLRNATTTFCRVHRCSM
ncbi:hypothetical protein NE237_007900 [Protea cynaroides]|uniref:Uncharacterized protein n=1 Tax=Protea cynaroides TaxID=273540 RepID=A0A9Q0KQA7_9MAGN|nr:hypothetical protein NE237_007900 [Protea cynaroides]